MQVTGKCIECPFHGWQYDGETGHCVKIPYSKGKVPSQAKVKVWPSLDSNGIVKVWYDAEGRDPQWFPEEFEKVKNGRWSYRGCSTHLINAHIEVCVYSRPHIEVCMYSRPHIEVCMYSRPHIEVCMYSRPHIEVCMYSRPHIEVCMYSRPSY